MNSKDTKEKELISLIKKDKKAFEKVYSLYYKKVLNYIRSRVNEKSVAEDLASEVFEKAFKAIEDFKWQGISLSAWIFRIARNLLTDYYRKVGRVGETVSLSEIEDLFEDPGAKVYLDFIKGEEEIALYDAIREFPEKDQYLIYYKFFEGFSNKEIAKITGLAESNVGTRLYRIRGKLRQILKKSGFEVNSR
ncbi:RNA polymerase sigma factor [Candidatus Dojkabacteria bacterium]|nr:RNA polymerase sigma factor [Candidatus Dojkabacteria bacterium]